MYQDICTFKYVRRERTNWYSDVKTKIPNVIRLYIYKTWIRFF